GVSLIAYHASSQSLSILLPMLSRHSALARSDGSVSTLSVSIIIIIVGSRWRAMVCSLLSIVVPCKSVSERLRLFLGFNEALCGRFNLLHDDGLVAWEMFLP